MEVTLHIPQCLAEQLGYTPELLRRRVLESLVVDECARGHLSRGKAAEVLALSFTEAEELFRARRVTYALPTAADDAVANKVLPPRRS